MSWQSSSWRSRLLPSDVMRAPVPAELFLILSQEEIKPGGVDIHSVACRKELVGWGRLLQQ